MDKENVIHTHYICNGVLLSHKDEWNYVICRRMVGTGNHHVKCYKPDGVSKMSAVLSHMQNLNLEKRMMQV
jgi:hypothetical protein